MDHVVTLGEATDIFDEQPNKHTARQLLHVARCYWRDGMIADETFGAIVDRIIFEWLS